MELERRFEQTVRAELAVPGTRAPRFPLLLPPALRETLLAFGPDEGAAGYYCERMPRLLVDQMLRGDDPARRLLWRALDPAQLPRLAGALESAFAVLRSVEIDPRDAFGAASPAELLSTRPSAAALAAPTLLGSGLPMIGALPWERDLLNRELASQAAEAVFDHRLSGAVLHELCHGPRRELSSPPAPWMVLESAAITLGRLAHPRHVFPDLPGEAVPGVSLFVLVGECLARLFGLGALLRAGLGLAPLAEAFGARAAAALEDAAVRDWQERREVPFARDALRALDWVGAVDGGRWAEEEPSPADFGIARTAVLALFQVNVLAPTFQTHPCETTHLVLDAHKGVLSRPRDTDGAFGEPAFWIFPPPLCRRLRERGAGKVIVEGPRRQDAAAIADSLIELALGSAPLQQTTVVRWTSSS